MPWMTPTRSRGIDVQRLTAEQMARDLLEEYGLEDAQALSAGDVVELANYISDARAYRGRSLDGTREGGSFVTPIGCEIGVWSKGEKVLDPGVIMTLRMEDGRTAEVELSDKFVGRLARLLVQVAFPMDRTTPKRRWPFQRAGRIVPTPPGMWSAQKPRSGP